MLKALTPIPKNNFDPLRNHCAAVVCFIAEYITAKEVKHSGVTFFPMWKTRFKDVKFAALKLGEQNPSAGADVVSVLRHVNMGNLPSKSSMVKNLHENRMCNQWDNWRAYGPELLL